MKRAIFYLLCYMSALSAMAEQPLNGILDRMIEAYPSAYRRVWYLFDADKGVEYYRTQFESSRKKIKPADISALSAAYLAEWDRTDFQKATGAQFRCPDSLSITIKGNEVMAYDLGPVCVAADWGKEVKGLRKAGKADFSKVIKSFENIAKGHRVVATDVSYSGFPKGIKFVFHRGQGRGITRGKRTTVYDASRDDYEKVRNAINSFIGSRRSVTVFDRTWQAMVKSEEGPEFYAVGYDPQTRVLNFLAATIENEICIPLEWQTINRLPK